MELLQAVSLGAIQGLTEFLPVSSSGHLILLPAFFSWEAQSVAFDAVLHIGTLLGVVLVLRADLWKLVKGWCAPVTSPLYAYRTLGRSLVIATVPILMIGALFHSWIEEVLRQPLVVAISLAFWGVMLYVADSFHRRRPVQQVTRVGSTQALWIGLSQIVALIPGTSRSGMTMMAGRFVGLDRATATRFSFLVSVPTIGASGAAAVVSALSAGTLEPWPVLLIGFVTSAVVGGVAVQALLAFVSRISFGWFTVYRLLLSAAVIWFLVLRG